MPVKATPRYIVTLLLVSSLLGFAFVFSFRNTKYGSYDMTSGKAVGFINGLAPSPKGHVIASKLNNETAKAELGRASWKYFHSVMARFPDEPTLSEQKSLGDYIHLFQRLYPCGECAAHFGEILQEYPPQVSSRSAAAAWACHVHNEVNKSLNKDLFDCTKIGDFYDCGCAEDNSTSTIDSKPVQAGAG